MLEKLEKLKASQEEMKSISDFRNVTKTRSSIHLTIVTTYGLEQNKHSGHVQSVVTTEDLFQPTWR